MFCRNCGAELDDNVKFCPSCGFPVNGPDAQNLNKSESMMDAKATSIVGYMTWIGFIIAICIGDKTGAKFYLNQALVFHIFCIPCAIPLIGWLWAIFMLICFILGVIAAAEQDPKELPLIGGIHILK